MQLRELVACRPPVENPSQYEYLASLHSSPGNLFRLHGHLVDARCAKSFHKTVLMLRPVHRERSAAAAVPVSVFAETAPSTVAMNEGAGVVLPAPPRLPAPSDSSGYHRPSAARSHECGDSSSRARAARFRCQCPARLMAHRRVRIPWTDEKLDDANVIGGLGVVGVGVQV